MAAEYWQIALFGTDNYYEFGTDNQIALSGLGTTDPMTDANWLKIPVYGGSPLRKHLSESASRNGGVSVQRGRQYRSFELHVRPLDFPVDMAFYEQIGRILDKKYVFLYKGTYDFKTNSFSIHDDNKAFAITGQIGTEDDYDNGRKLVTINARGVYPIPKGA